MGTCQEAFLRHALTHGRPATLAWRGRGPARPRVPPAARFRCRESPSGRTLAGPRDPLSPSPMPALGRRKSMANATISNQSKILANQQKILKKLGS